MAHCCQWPLVSPGEILHGCRRSSPPFKRWVDRGEATRGLTVKIWGGHLILGRVDQAGPDPRFRLTPLGGGRYGLSLYDRNRWDPLPYEGTLSKLLDVMNTDLSVWAAAWPEVPT